MLITTNRCFISKRLYCEVVYIVYIPPKWRYANLSNTRSERLFLRNDTVSKIYFIRYTTDV